MRSLTRKPRIHALGGLLAAAVLTGCAAESSTAPELSPASQELAIATSANMMAPVDLGVCENVAVPAGSHLVAHLYARGTQRYFWLGTRWLNIGPAAVLYLDEAGRVEAGAHEIAGVWESISGSKVVGIVQQRCTADPSAIEWQRLGALGSIGPGLFDHVDYIQRVRTEGGIGPVAPGSVYGETVHVPFTAEYFFYRADN